MYTQAGKTQENKTQSVANSISHEESASEPAFQFVDNRPEITAQRKLIPNKGGTVQLMPGGNRGGNPIGRGGGKHGRLKQQSLISNPRKQGNVRKPKGKSKPPKKKQAKILQQLLRVGKKTLGFDDGLSMTHKRQITILVAHANKLLFEPGREYLLAYIEAVNKQISNDGMVQQVILKIKERSGAAEGHFNRRDNEVVLNTGEIEQNPFMSEVEENKEESEEQEELKLVSPQDFLALVVHEFTHVMDFSTREFIDEDGEDNSEYTDYATGQGELSHETSADYLKAMIGDDQIAAQYNKKSPGITYSEILARFAEAGVKGEAPAEMKRGFMEYRRGQFFLAINQVSKDEAIVYANGRARQLLLDIFNKVILPFVRASEDPAVGHYFLQILFEIGSGEDIADEGEIEWKDNLKTAIQTITEMFGKEMGNKFGENHLIDFAVSETLTPSAASSE